MKILVSASPGELRVAAVDESGLVDFALERAAAPDGVGDLHRGRVVARVPAMAGAFVALDGAEGFLPDSEGGAVPEGTVLAVRVVRAAQGAKGPRLTARVTAEDSALVGSGPPALLRRGPGAVLRLAALHPGAPVLVDDFSSVPELRATLGERVRAVPRAFDDETEEAVAALAEPVAALPGGARVHISPTPALVALDVDLGAATAARGGKARGQEAANRALLPALARQIRLRNLSGAIVADLGGLSVARRRALAGDFAAALEDDPLRPRFLGFSALGLAEILRPRVAPPLHELLGTPHAAALAALRAAARESDAHPERAVSVVATPAIVTALRADTAALDTWRRRTGRAPELREDATLPSPGWRIDGGFTH